MRLLSEGTDSCEVGSPFVRRFKVVAYLSHDFQDILSGLGISAKGFYFFLSFGGNPMETGAWESFGFVFFKHIKIFILVYRKLIAQLNNFFSRC